MRNSAKLIAALSVAGLAVAAGSAFTGAGLTNTATTAQFIGGTVGQTVTGAKLSTVGYTFSDDSNTALTRVTLNFADADSNGKSAALTLKDADVATADVEVSCAVIAAASTTCSVTNYVGMTSLDITVS